MKIKKKLLVVFIGLASMVGIVGYLAINSLKNIATDINQVKQSSILEVESSTEMAFELVFIKGLFEEYIYKTIENDSARIAIVQRKLEEGFMDFEKALELRKSITTSGLELYKGEELEDEKEELNKIEYLENKYKIYKRNILEVISGYTKNGDVLKYTLHKNEWQQKDSILIEELKMYKKEAEEEIASKTSQVLSEAKNSTSSMILIAAISFILAIIAGVFISKSIVSPILKLNIAAQNIALGNMDITADVKSADEIGDLTTSFKKMARDLKKSRTKIEEYNKNLEQKVNERTTELEENIQKLKEAEITLKTYANNLKVSNLELEQFAYVASHDLQEPLRTITSFVQIFNQQYFGKLDSKSDKYLKYIVQASDRMRVLIKDLLDYSRIGHNKALEQVDSAIILRDVIADIDKAIKDSHAKINAEHLPVISGYTTELKQLFQNLILNSIKFRKKDALLKINIEAQKKNDYWQFAFADNGIGIDEQHNERIFIIFQRLHTRSEYQGSGIGLSHCKKIVELHHGKIWVESTLNTGSTFYFTIHSPKEKINEPKIKLHHAH